MASTTFIDRNYPAISAAWLNDVNDLTYNLAASSGSNRVGFIQSGTGAVLRTAQNKLRENFTVKDFGAVADGFTDNNTAWNVASVVAELAGLKHIEVPDGAYAISGTVTIAPGVTFAGKSSNITNATAGYGVSVIHIAAVANTDLFVVDSGVVGSYISSGSVQNMAITASAANTRYGLYMRNFIGALPTNLQFSGGFTGAAIAIKGCLNSTFSNIRILNGTTTEVPAAIRLLSGSTGGVVDIYSTTATFRNLYVSGKIAPGSGGIASVFVADPGAGKEIVFDDITYESINGKAWDIAKGNQVIVKAPYCENVPNSNTNIPMFEVGVTGGAAPDNAYDTATSFVVEGQGGILMQYSQGAATNTRLINADVAQYLEIHDIQLDRVIQLISGTNNTQQFRMSGLKAPTVTTITSGMTDYKVFDLGGNVFQAASLTASHRSGTNATRQAMPQSLFSHGDMYLETDVGTEGRVSVLNKSTGLFNATRVKNGVQPTTRSWIRGDVVDNAFPAVGGPLGWTSTASGTPGTWIPTGQLGALFGTTANRPTTDMFPGKLYFDTTLAANGKPIWYTGTGAIWVDATGAIV